MKTILIVLFLVFQTFFLSAQEFNVVREGKAVVYFVRASALGGLINFTFFDGEKVIGRFNGGKYMRYECDPGEHLFWARSENRSFVEANISTGNIYVIDVVPRMGGIKAAVRLFPVDKAKYKLKSIQKLVSKRAPESFTEVELNEIANEKEGVLERGMEKYQKLKADGEKIPQLVPEMTIDPQDLIYIKKSKKNKNVI